MIVDGGLWLSRPRHISKEDVKALSRAVEKTSRMVGLPSSKLWSILLIGLLWNCCNWKPRTCFVLDLQKLSVQKKDLPT